jgi:hypothetical protein
VLEHFGTGTKKGRGRAQKSVDLVDAMREIAEAAQPITGRGVGYKLFARGLIPSMGVIKNKDGTKTHPMRNVYRLLKEAREEGIIPWEWIVDETRSLERVSSWSNPAEFVQTVSRAYRRDFWGQQPVRVEVWSEKGTIRGVIAPVLDAYGVGFRVMHGFSGATSVYDIAQDDDGRPLVALYVGDYDPSGMFMSCRDLPDRLKKYGGDHIELNRIALHGGQLSQLPSFPASDKKGDPRHEWFVKRFGDRCWELDALDPNDLRACVEKAIKAEIEPTEWARCVTVQKAEQESMRTVLDSWNIACGNGPAAK